MGDALASIISLSNGGDSGRKPTPGDATALAWKVVAVLQAPLLAAATTLCHVKNTVHWGFVCFIPSLFFTFLAWAMTLDDRCSLWPLRVTFFMVGTTASLIWN